MVVAEVRGLNAVNGTPLQTPPTINTDISFSTTADQNPVAQECKTILPLTQDTVTTTYKLQGVATEGGFLKNLSDFKTALEPADQNFKISDVPIYEVIDRYLSDIETRQLPVLELVQSCRQEKDVENEDLLTKQRDATEESQTRLERIRNPERATSYYEGWFPIFRPLQEQTLFALFGVAMALLVLSLYIFLKLSDVEFNVSIASGGAVGGLLSSLPSFGEIGPYLIGGVLLGVIGATLIYRYL
jgi:hypothetical protein